MQVDFYQLERDPVDRVLPAIAQRLLDQGERLLVIDGREGALERLSRALWSWKPDSFLAHGLADGENAQMQPILLSTGEAPLNGARHVALTDGQWRESALTFERTFHFFDADTIDAARASWRALKGREGVTARFWRQDGGKWIQAA